MTKIAILSDSHGKAQQTAAAVNLLLPHQPDLLIHLGDICNIAVLDALAVNDHTNTKQLPVRLVFGNSDYNITPMAQYAQDLGLTVDHPVGRLTLENSKRLAFTHGDNHHIMSQLLHQQTDYILHGHTHLASDQMHGPSRVINPGAFTRVRQPTVALLDTHNDSVMFFPVGDA